MLDTGGWVLDLHEHGRLKGNPAHATIWGHAGSDWFREHRNLLAAGRTPVMLGRSRTP